MVLLFMQGGGVNIRKKIVWVFFRIKLPGIHRSRPKAPIHLNRISASRSATGSYNGSGCRIACKTKAQQKELISGYIFFK